MSTGVPGTSEVAPSVLVIDRSDCGVNVSVSVAVLLAEIGSVVPGAGVTVAVLVSEPGCAGGDGRGHRVGDAWLRQAG